MKTNAEPLLDLRTIPTADLKLLAEICASQPNKPIFQDNFVILSRILLVHHECYEMDEYSERELSEAIAIFARSARSQSIPAGGSSDEDVSAIQFDGCL